MQIEPSLGRRVGRVIALGRIGVGAVALAAPSVALRPWIGARRGDAGALALGRAVGARDLGLGLGFVLAERHGQPVRGWLEAGGLADGGDALATLVAFGSLPRLGRWAVLAAAAGSAAAAFTVARSVEAAPPGADGEPDGT